MCKRIIPFTFSLLFVIAAMAQDFARVKFTSPHGQVATSRATCPDNILGNISGFGPITSVDGGPGMSNSVPMANDVTFLCFGDQFSITYDDTNLQLNGDPNTVTPSGVAYIAYRRDPNEPDAEAEDGPDIATILADTILLGDPNDVQSIVFAADLLLNGNETFENKVFPNGQTLQETYSPNGEPIQIWFAPISVDAYDGANNEVIYEGTPAGECVTVDLEEAFSVVYLNPIEFVNVTYPFGGDGSKARLNVSGGLPEFDETQVYTYDIINIADPSIRGSIVEGGLGHREFPVIQVPCPGDYRIQISDGRSCALEMIQTMDQFEKPENALEIKIESPTGVTLGQEFCVDITAENFDSIVGGTFFLCWDPDVLEFQRVDNIVSNTWLIGQNLADQGSLIPNFLEQDFDGGTTLPDGTVLFSACFIPISAGTGSTAVEFCTDDPRPNSNNPPDIITAVGGQIAFPDDPENNGQPIVITDPDALNILLIDAEVKDACVGRDNGSFALQVLGGIPPYTAVATNTLTGEVDGPQIINEQDPIVIFENLEPGDYTYEVFDGTAAPATKISGILGPVTIRSANLGVNGLIVSTPTCNADSNGVMQAEVSLDGVVLTDLSTYTFIWIDAVGDTIQGEDEEMISGLASGSYEIIATSNNGCTASDPGASLTQPAPMSVTPTSIDPSCSGVMDGLINISDVDGGNGPFEFDWSDGSDLSTNNNIASGNYKFTITDDGGCQLRDSFLLTAQNEFSVSIASIDPVQCFGFDNGRININRSIDRGTGATGTFNFMWSDNVTDLSGIASISSTAGSLAPGSYSVTLTNDALPGCEAEETFEITEPDSLMVQNFDITNVSSCSLTNPDGGIAATISGGTIANDYQYTWIDTMGMTIGATNEVMNQASGMITLMVADDNGCMTTIDTVIGTPPPPNIDFFDPVDLNCATDMGALQVIATPGRAGVLPLTFQWSHDPMLDSDVANNLRPDTFLVTVIDNDGCASQAISWVTAPEAIRTDTVMFTQPCFGTDEGEVNLTLAGGVSSNYQIEWTAVNETSVLGTSSILPNVGAGDYLLTATDENNCPYDTMITLISLPRIAVTFDQASITGVDCFDTVNPADCNGTASATAEYEIIGGGAFTFTWGATSETAGATNTFNSSSLCAGMQALIVSDGQCEVIDSVNIPSPERVEFDIANANITPAKCFGEMNGVAEVAAIGGTGDLTFTWPDGGMETTKMGLAANTYQITITDENACIATHDIEITQPAGPLTASIDTDNTNGVICEGDADGLITVLVEGGNEEGSYNFTWTNNVSTINSAAGLAPGNYIILVTDSKGCEADTDYLVQEPTPITAQIDFDPIQCFGFQTGIRILAPTGGNGNNYSFSVDNSPARPSDESITDFGGEKLISLFDASGCRVDTMVTIPQPRELLVGFAENLVEVDLGGAIPIDLLIDGDAPVAEIFWTQDGGEVSDSVFTCIGIPCDDPIVNPLNNTSFTAFVTDANGCMSEASIQVDVDKNRNVYIPNVFAPNNAGFDTNDRFGVFTGSGVSKINYAKVFNRWGTMVANIPETRVQGIGEVVQVWDGLLKGEKANQGTYIYIIEIEFIDGQKLLYRGDVALLR